MVWWGTHRYPTGHGPFDSLPPLLGARSPMTLVTAPTTKLVYRTWTYPTSAASTQFHVAELQNHAGWVSYYFDQSTGKRTYYAGYVPATGSGPQIDQLEKDFGL